MIACDYCGRGHRSAEQVEKCKAKAERVAAAMKKRDDERERRERNGQAMPLIKLIRERRAIGWNWDKVAAEIKKDFPTDWPTSVYWIIRAYAEAVVAPNWGVDTDTATNALLEKFMLGDFVSWHPLGVPSAEKIESLSTQIDIQLQEEVEYDDD